MTFEEIEKLCKKSVSDVGEYVDHAVIIVTWQEGGETQRVFDVSGNWYACVGLAHDFLESATHADLADKLAEAISKKEGWDEDDD